MNDVPHLTLVFSLLLLLSSLLSERADRTLLSLPVLFLFGGLATGFISGTDRAQGASWLGSVSEVALVCVLFTDGALSGWKKLRSVAKITLISLCLGLPITIVIISFICHFLLDLSWIESLLVGSVLCPTDPVFASGLVGRKTVPARLGDLLNTESGLNDALALPAVLFFLNLLKGTGEEFDVTRNIGVGLATGIIVPWVSVKLLRFRFFRSTELYGRLFCLSVFLVVFSLTEMFAGNIFLSVFLSGVVLATLEPELAESFHEIGLPLTEMLKLLAVFLFGAAVAPHFFALFEGHLFLAALVILILARPFPFFFLLMRTDFDLRERFTIGWFGPRGFASVIFALIFFQENLPHRSALFHIMILTITLSIIVHSSTDVLFLRWITGKKEFSK